MSKFQPDGWHTVTPRILVRDPQNLVAYLKQVFNTRGEFRPVACGNPHRRLTNRAEELAALCDLRVR